MNKERARGLHILLSALVDKALEQPRDPNNPPTDGNVAVMTVFEELEKMGYIMIHKSVMENPRNSRMK